MSEILSELYARMLECGAGQPGGEVFREADARAAALERHLRERLGPEDRRALEALMQAQICADGERQEAAFIQGFVAGARLARLVDAGR
ncbi:MAG: DUF6809 family protein [Christensenellales bacterium]|jgi:hypothetical protein